MVSTLLTGIGVWLIIATVIGATVVLARLSLARHRDRLRWTESPCYRAARPVARRSRGNCGPSIVHHRGKPRLP